MKSWLAINRYNNNTTGKNLTRPTIIIRIIKLCAQNIQQHHSLFLLLMHSISMVHMSMRFKFAQFSKTKHFYVDFAKVLIVVRLPSQATQYYMTNRSHIRCTAHRIISPRNSMTSHCKTAAWRMNK